MRCANCKHWLTDINKTEAEKADMESFKVIGYYICEIIDTPEWLQGISRQILSVSGCIGEQHPRWECFMGGWGKGSAREYQERLQLDEGRYRDFSETHIPECL